MLTYLSRVTRTIAALLLLGAGVPGHAQTATFQYRPLVKDLIVTGSPSTSGALTGASLSVSTPQLSFASTPVGTTAALSVLVINTGTANGALSLPTVAGPGYTASTNCSTVLAPNASCAVTVTFAPLSSGPLTGALSIGTGADTPALNVALTGSGLDAAGQLSADTTYDFGALNVGDTVQRSFTFQNTGGASLSGLQAGLSAYAGLTLTANTCGSGGAPVTLAPGATCAMTVRWAPTTKLSLNQSSVYVSGLYAGNKSIGLEGTSGGFNATLQGFAAWDTRMTAAPVTSLGPITVNHTTTTTFYMRNTGTVGTPSLGMTLTGDTSAFQIVGFSTYYYAQLSASANCVFTATSAANCGSTYDPANGGATGYAITVRYSPSAVGTQTAQLNFTTGNGTRLNTNALTFTGTAAFNPTLQAFSTADTRFTTGPVTALGPITLGTSTSTTLYMRNTGTFGAPNLGLSLTGDTTAFQVTGFAAYYSAQGSASMNCPFSGTLAAFCTSPYDPSGGGETGYAITVKYTPVAAGTQTATLTFNTQNNPALNTTLATQSVTLTGTAQFNAVLGAYSTADTRFMTLPTTNYGTLAVGQTKDTTMYFRNSGTHGKPNLGITLSGDTGAFEIRSMGAYYSAQGSASMSCPVSASAAANCQSPYDPANGGATGFYLTLRYLGNAVGAQSVTMNYTTANGTTLPTPLTFTGAAH